MPYSIKSSLLKLTLPNIILSHNKHNLGLPMHNNLLPQINIYTSPPNLNLIPNKRSQSPQQLYIRINNNTNIPITNTLYHMR